MIIERDFLRLTNTEKISLNFCLILYCSMNLVHFHTEWEKVLLERNNIKME